MADRRRSIEPLERMSSAQRRWLLSVKPSGLIDEPANVRSRQPVLALVDKGMLVEVGRQSRFDKRRYRLTPRAVEWIAAWKANHPDRPVRYSSPFAPAPVHMRYDLALQRMRADDARYGELHAADRLDDAQRQHGRPYISELLI